MSPSRRFVCAQFCGFSLTILLFCGSSTLYALTNSIGYKDSFEQFPAGTAIVNVDGLGINGWTGEPSTGTVAKVAATNYTYTTTALPIDTAHTKVLKIDGKSRIAFATNQYESQYNLDRTYANDPKRHSEVFIDCMIKPGHLNKRPSKIPADAQLALYFNTNGHLTVWHALYDEFFQNETQVWTELNHAPVSSNEWIRLTISMFYFDTNLESEYFPSEQFFRIQINGGPPLESPNALPTPIYPDGHGGSWFLCADSGWSVKGTKPISVNNGYLSSLSFEGGGAIDDLVVTNVPPKFTRGDPGTTNPVLLAFMEKYNITNTNEMSRDGDADGFNEWAEFYAGTHPRDPLSYMYIFAASNSGGTSWWHTIKWLGSSMHGATNPFIIYRAQNLSTNKTAWSPVSTNQRNATATQTTNTWTDKNIPPGSTRLFYKVSVPRTPLP